MSTDAIMSYISECSHAGRLEFQVSIQCAPVLKGIKFGSLLFDLITDPMQERPIQDEIQEERMLGLLRICMQENEAPTEQYERLGLQ